MNSYVRFLEMKEGVKIKELEAKVNRLEKALKEIERVSKGRGHNWIAYIATKALSEEKADE